MEAFDKYIDYLENIKHYSKQTISSYSFDLKGFEKYMKEKKLLLESLNEEDIQDYISFLRKSNLKITSINRKIVCLRNFYKYYTLNLNCNAKNVMLNFKTLKQPQRLPKDLFIEQIKVLLTPNEKNPLLALRNQCIILLLLNTGMRVSECRNLDLLDVVL